MDDDLVEAPLVDGCPQQRDVAVVEGIVGAEEQPDAALRGYHRPKVREQPDQEERPAQPKAQQQEPLPGARHAGRAEGRQGDVDQNADEGVAVRIPDPPRDEIAAQVLGSLRGQRGDHRGAGKAAHGRNSRLVERTPP